MRAGRRSDSSRTACAFPLVLMEWHCGVTDASRPAQPPAARSSHFQLTTAASSASSKYVARFRRPSSSAERLDAPCILELGAVHRR